MGNEAKKNPCSEPGCDYRCISCSHSKPEGPVVIEKRQSILPSCHPQVFFKPFVPMSANSAKH